MEHRIKPPDDKSGLVVHEGLGDLREMKLTMLKTVLRNLVFVPLVVLGLGTLLVIAVLLALHNLGIVPGRN